MVTLTALVISIQNFKFHYKLFYIVLTHFLRSLIISIIKSQERSPSIIAASLSQTRATVTIIATVVFVLTVWVSGEDI